MKLTSEIIESSPQYINPATRDRELDLRGLKISVIENLGATLDQFDSIDFSDNDVRKLDGFPLLSRLKKLLFNNNRVSRIVDGVEECIPNLEWLILTNNQIQELGDIDSLSKFTKLECLSLLNNPVASKKYYRLYVINKLPSLRILDFRKVKLKERQEAVNLFKGDKGKILEKDIGIKSKTFTPGLVEARNQQPAMNKTVHTPAAVEAIKAAIAKAKTIEEIERLKQLLKAGYIPEKNEQTKSNSMKVDESGNRNSK